MKFVVFWRSLGSAALCLAVLALAGCGASGANKGRVTGKVTANGQPVTGGQLTFSPAAGVEGAAPALGPIESDGTFVLSTDRAGDGAAIGKHTVSYVPPNPEGSEKDGWDGSGPEPPPSKPSPFAGLVVKDSEVEVKSGSNELTIELVPAGGS